MSCKIRRFFAIPSGTNISTNPLTGKPEGYNRKKMSRYERLCDWKNRSNDEQQRYSRGVEAFVSALSADLPHTIAEKLKQQELSDLYDSSGIKPNGTPLDSERARRVALKGYAMAKKKLRLKKTKFEEISSSAPQENDSKKRLSTGEGDGNELSNSTGEQEIFSLEERAKYLTHLTEDRDTLKGSYNLQFEIIGTELIAALSGSSSDATPTTRKEYLKLAKNLRFAEIARDRHFWQDKRIVTVSDGLLTKIALAENPSEMSKITSEMKGENKVTNAVFKAYIATHFGPDVAEKLWHPSSELASMLDHGAALTQRKVKELLKKAAGERFQISFGKSRWCQTSIFHMERPKNWLESACVKENKAYFDSVKSAQIYVRIVRPGYTNICAEDSEAIARIQNKATILAFMDYLEAEGFGLSVCAYIWKQYFSAHFIDGSKELFGDEIAKIYSEAQTLQRLSSLHVKEQDAQDAFTQHVKASSIDSERLESLSEISYYLDRWLPGSLGLGGENLLPDNKHDVHQNRALLLNVAQYVSLFWGEAIAEDVWETQLKSPYTMGIRIGSDEILGILKKAQERAQNPLKPAEQEIEKYARTVLRNSAKNRMELSPDKHLPPHERKEFEEDKMKQLQTNFKIAAFQALWSRGRRLTSDEMDQINTACYVALLSKRPQQPEQLSPQEEAFFENVPLSPRRGNSRPPSDEIEGVDEYHEKELEKEICVEEPSDEPAVESSNDASPNAKPPKETTVKDRLQAANQLSLGPDLWTQRMANWLNDLDKDKLASLAAGAETSGNVINFVRNAGNFAKYIWVIHTLAPDADWQTKIKKWTEYYQITILTDEERNEFFAKNAHVITSDPQAIGVIGSFFGACLELRALEKTLRDNKQKEHNIEMLCSHFRTTLKLKYVCHYMLKNINNHKIRAMLQQEGFNVPSASYLIRFNKEIDQELIRVEHQIKAKIPATYDPFVDDPYKKYRHMYGCGVSLGGMAAGVTFTAGSCPHYFGFGLWDRDELALILGNLGLDGIGLFAAPLNAYNTAREYTLLKRANALHRRAASVYAQSYRHLYEHYDDGLYQELSKEDKEKHIQRIKNFLKCNDDEAEKILKKSFRNESKRAFKNLSLLDRADFQILSRLSPHKDGHDDSVFKTHLAYRKEKLKTKSFSTKAHRMSSDRVIVDDMLPDIAKSIDRQHKAGLHYINVVLRGTSTVGSISCAISSFAMVGAEGGMLGGSVVGPWGTVAGTILGGIVAAVFGIGTACVTFLVSDIYGRRTAYKNKTRIDSWLDAYAHHEGPKWDLIMDGLNVYKSLNEKRVMEEFGLDSPALARVMATLDFDTHLKGNIRFTDDEIMNALNLDERLQEDQRRNLLSKIKLAETELREVRIRKSQLAEALAFRKLIRTDIDLALKITAERMIEERLKNNKPVTQMLKKNFRPHQNHEGKQAKFMKNMHWEAHIERLTELEDPKMIASQLKHALVAPQHVELQLNNLLSPR